MPYVGFHELCPDIAQNETRTITLPRADFGLPAGSYLFVEMFCDEPDCDCRRVMFSVMSSASTDIEAVIAWGWESVDFYKRWFGADDPEIASEMTRPILNVASAQSRNARAILKLFETQLLCDAPYVARLKRHYAIFREKVHRAEESNSPRNRQPSVRLQASAPSARRPSQKASAPGAFKLGDRIGRNDPCPCGSGKKFKVCCMK